MAWEHSPAGGDARCRTSATDFKMPPLQCTRCSLCTDLVSSRVSQQGGATYDLMTSRDPAHVTVTSLATYSDVDKSTTCNAERGVNVTSVTSTSHQPTAADFSQHTHSAYVYVTEHEYLYRNRSNNIAVDARRIFSRSGRIRGLGTSPPARSRDPVGVWDLSPRSRRQVVKIIYK